MLTVTLAHRRARIARRHGLSAPYRHPDVLAATKAMTALHATEPATPHLSLLARVRALTVADVERALYEERSLVKVMGMRRTLFVVTRDLIAPIAASVGARVAEANRKRLLNEATAVDGRHEGWIDDAERDVVAALDGRSLSVRQLRDELEHLGGTFLGGAGTKWAAEVSTMSRLLTIFAASGSVVRATNAGHWRISRPTFTSMASWLGEPLEPFGERDGYAALVRHWLGTFGPGTEADLVWWLGSTKRAVRTSLADVEAVEVAFEDGSSGWVLPDDTADLERPASVEPWVALLPTLDPTTMGWRDRDFYLDPAHVPYLFDTAGNGGNTVWVDGRIVGSWVQDDTQRVVPILREAVSPSARGALDREVARLDEFL
ncbi:MAG: winged helix DNA-binding domain-containing protein, partial [Ilumatobacteraceae bacterium]